MLKTTSVGSNIKETIKITIGERVLRNSSKYQRTSFPCHRQTNKKNLRDHKYSITQQVVKRRYCMGFYMFYFIRSKFHSTPTIDSDSHS